MENINSISPIQRDNLLVSNIGKYNQISERLIYPIGHSYDIYSAVPIKKESITKNGLLDYINSNKVINKNGELEFNIFLPDEFVRDKNSIDLDYSSTQPQKYSYTEGNTYHDPVDKNWISMGIDAAIGYAMGDSVALDFSGGGVSIISSSLDSSTSLIARVAEVALGDSNLGSIGLKSLATQFANSVAQKTRMLEGVQDFFKKPVGFYDAVDTLDFDKMGALQIPAGFLGFAQSMIPMYFYTEVKRGTISNGTVNYSWINNSENLTYESDDFSEPPIVTGLIFSPQSLLSKTQKLFSSGKIETMITNKSKYTATIGGTIQGDTISRGRNLSKKNADDEMCRVWTINSQYNKISSLIRPFNEANVKKLNATLNPVRPGYDAIDKYGVLQKDGFVKISPYKTDSFGKEDVKKYMFSIENLAWKGSIDSLIDGTSQDGPNGGRLMWFPPYDISFNETTSVNWNADTFIGRGEPVYTYINTERSGTLNFKIIVDHPSIINYYQRDGVDIDGNPIEEDDYLRFFAGCDVLELGGLTVPPEPTTEPVVTPKNKPRTMTFKVYFPNNYSGANETGGYSDAITYLYEGKECTTVGGGPGYENLIGPWSGLTSEPASHLLGCYLGDYYYRVDTHQKLKPEQYKDMASFGLNSTKDSPSDPNSFSFREACEFIDTNEVINTEDITSKKATYDLNNSMVNFDDANMELMDARNELKIILNETPGHILPNDDPYITRVSLAELDYNEKTAIYLQASKKDESLNNTKSKSTNLTIITGNNTGIQSERNSYPEMKNINNKRGLYVDFQKNVLNYLNICTVYANELSKLSPGSPEYYSKKSQYEIAKGDYEYSLESDVYGYYTSKLTFLDYNDSYLATASEKTYNDFYQTLLDATAIGIAGSASKHGIETDNTKLADNRASIIKKWLSEINKKDIYKLKSTYALAAAQPDKNTSSKVAKIDRFAYVIVTTDPAGIDMEKELNKIGYTTIVEDKTPKAPGSPTRVKKSMYGYYYDPLDTDNPKTKLKNDESQFFQKIAENGDSDNKFIFDKLSEKIKYFHPAFHSTTPEGFNTRLTFLHQCTRQGPTASASETSKNKRSATNMAFGRPPICVLRIGDFYHTKVIFESLNIDFDPLVWDLNQEGIGVQPMIATVSMNFKFIGGSDLTGPIARLQNAVTFNFFANTGVYDDRNDRLTSTNSEKKAADTSGKYQDQYDPLYNPSIYDSAGANASAASSVGGIGTPTSETSSTVPVTPSTANSVNSKDKIEAAKVEPRSEEKQQFKWVDGEYTYNLVRSGPARHIEIVDKLNVVVLKCSTTFVSVQEKSNQQFYEEAKAIFTNK